MKKIQRSPSAKPDIHTSAIIGNDVTFGSSVSVDAEAVIGENSAIEAGARIGRGARLGPSVYIGPNAVIGFNDGLSTSVVFINERVRVGANATVISGVTIASDAIVRPGSVVTRSVPARAIVEGNPATIVGYTGAGSIAQGESFFHTNSTSKTVATIVRGVTFHTMPEVTDLRGNLTVGEFLKDIPFVPQRYFMVFGVPNREVRGEHAHRECHQFLICVRGSCSVVADDGEQRIEVLLDAPEKGLYLPPMIWGIQYKYSSDAMLLVFASHHYDAADYIRDYGTFLAMASGRSSASALEDGAR